MRRNILGNHRACRDNCALSDSDPVSDNGTGPQPNIIFNHNPFGCNALFYKWTVRIVEDMVDCNDLSKRRGVYTVPNLDSPLSSDDRILADQTITTNPDT